MGERRKSLSIVSTRFRKIFFFIKNPRGKCRLSPDYQTSLHSPPYGIRVMCSEPWDSRQVVDICHDVVRRGLHTIR